MCTVTMDLLNKGEGKRTVLFLTHFVQLVIEAFRSATRKIIGCFHNGGSLTNAHSFIRHHCHLEHESFTI